MCWFVWRLGPTGALDRINGHILSLRSIRWQKSLVLCISCHLPKSAIVWPSFVINLTKEYNFTDGQKKRKKPLWIKLELRYKFYEYSAPTFKDINIQHQHFIYPGFQYAAWHIGFWSFLCLFTASAKAKCLSYEKWPTVDCDVVDLASRWLRLCWWHGCVSVWHETHWQSQATLPLCRSHTSYTSIACAAPVWSDVCCHGDKIHSTLLLRLQLPCFSCFIHGRE